MVKDKFKQKEEKQTKVSDTILYYKKLRAGLKRLPKAFRYHDIIYELLNNILEFELGFEGAKARLTAELDGTVVNWSQNDLDSLRKKFSEILLIDGLVNNFGIPSLRDSIMEKTIERLFGAKQIQKELSINDLLKQLYQRKK